jgi:hypothetical protein
VFQATGGGRALQPDSKPIENCIPSGGERTEHDGGIMKKTRLWLRWVAANGLAEIVALGICGIGATIVMDLALAGPSIISITAGGGGVVLIGATAGLVLGWAQWIVLRGCVPTIGARHWVAATTIGGMLSWLVAMVPNTVVGLSASDTGAPPEFGIGMLAIALAAGAASGVALSTPQFYVLRSSVKDAGWWIVANALAWMIVTPPYLTVVDSMARTTSLPTALLSTLGASGITGALAGCIHGGFLVWLLAPRNNFVE